MSSGGIKLCKDFMCPESGAGIAMACRLRTLLKKNWVLPGTKKLKNTALTNSLNMREAKFYNTTKIGKKELNASGAGWIFADSIRPWTILSLNPSGGRCVQFLFPNLCRIVKLCFAHIQRICQCRIFQFLCARQYPILFQQCSQSASHGNPSPTFWAHKILA